MEDIFRDCLFLWNGQLFNFVIVLTTRSNLDLNKLPQQLQYSFSLLVEAKCVALRGMVCSSRNYSNWFPVAPLITSIHSVYIFAEVNLLFGSIFSRILVEYYNISFSVTLSFPCLQEYFEFQNQKIFLMGNHIHNLARKYHENQKLLCRIILRKVCYVNITAFFFRPFVTFVSCELYWFFFKTRTSHFC